MPLVEEGTPWPQPAPDWRTYSVLPMKPTSAGPKRSALDPSVLVPTLVGRLSTTVARLPDDGSILDMRPPVGQPKYGEKTFGCRAVQLCVLHNAVGPVPASATYKLPSGPKFNPLG